MNARIGVDTSGTFGDLVLIDEESGAIRTAKVPSTRTPGGAGFGDPHLRDPEAVRKDVLEGYVSAEAAMRDYGWEDGT